MKNEAFKKFYAKLRWEGILRAFFCGLAIGFMVLLYSATLCWFFGFKGIWLSIVLFVVAVAAVTSLLYFLVFSPDTKKTAKRIDELGLEERIITMTELEGDNSFIAVKQREDAMAAIGKLNAGAMKFIVSVPVILTCVVFGFYAMWMTALHALNVADVMPSGIELVQGEKPEQFYNLAYSVDGNGLIYGVYNGDISFIGNDKNNKKCDVKVKAGEKSDAVIAVADDGYVFVGWSDGYGNPYRESVTINENKILTAVFQPIPDEGEEIDEKDDVQKTTAEVNVGEGTISALKLAVGTNGNTATTMAAGGGFSPGTVGGYGGPNSNPIPGEPGEPGPSDEAPPDNTGSEAGDGPGGDEGGDNDTSASKQVIDGSTYYGDVYDNAYEDAMSYLNSNEDLPDYLKKIIKDYFDTIAI